MLGKRTRPGKLPDSFMSGGRTGYPEAITSPKCSLEFRIVSPRSLKNSEPIHGVGLGIVAALEKSGSGEKTLNTTPTRSHPIPIGVPVTKFNEVSPQEPELGGESMEESYTYVTSHRHNKSCNKGQDGGKGHDRNEVCNDMGWKSSCFFYESPPQRITEASRGEYFPKLDFLSSCYLCRKKLHGKDIYMYRGDKAFCSTECRCRQITMDEWKEKEKCGSEARSVEVSSSPYSRDNLFFTGIIAT